MSELLKEWLGSLLKRELSTLLSVRQQGTSESKKGSTVIQGTTITIDTKCWKAPRVVQLLKFCSYETPTRAIVSDSCWTVEAEFRPAAVESFENSHFNQPITRDTTGGLVQIQADCQLVVKSDFAATDFLLVIHDCQFRGSGGSGPYGHPRELGSAGPIQELLQDLFSNPEQAKLDGDGDGASGESPRVCVSATQVSLSTQLLPRRGPSRDSVGPRLMHAALTQFKSQTTSSQLGHDERLSTRVRDKVDLNRAGLINLLENRRALSECVPQTPYSVKSGKRLSRSSTGPSSPHGPFNERADAAGSPQSFSLKQGQSWTITPLPDGSLLVAGPDPDCEPKRYSEFRRTEPPHRDSICTIKEQSRLNEDQTLGERINRKENQRQDRPIKHHSHQSSERQSPQKMGMEPVIAAAGFSSFVFSNDEDPWQGMTRIRKRETKIPRDQQILLDSEDSWYPPEPGSRGPVANIPVRLLARISEIAERRLHETAAIATAVKEPARLRVHSERESRSESASLPVERDIDDDLENTHSAAISRSSSPPQSPKYDQLPPDSSAPRIDANNDISEPPKGLTRASVFENDSDDELEDSQPSKRRRTEKMGSLISTNTSFEKEEQSGRSSISRLSWSSKSLSSEKHPIREISESPLQNECDKESPEKPVTPSTDISAPKAADSQRCFPRMIDSGCDVDDSDMESCLPTALGEKVQDAPEVDTPPSKRECSTKKRKPCPEDDVSSIAPKRIKLEKLFTFRWEESKQKEDVSSNLHKLKAAFFQREEARLALSSPEQISSSTSPVINPESVSRGCSSANNPSSNTPKTPRGPIPSIPPSSVIITPSRNGASTQHMTKPSSPSQSVSSDSSSAMRSKPIFPNSSPNLKLPSNTNTAPHQPTPSILTSPAAILLLNEGSSPIQQTTGQGSPHGLDRPRSPSPVLDPPPSLQPTTPHAHATSSPLLATKEGTNHCSLSCNEAQSEPPPRRPSRSNSRSKTSLETILGYIPWWSRSSQQKGRRSTESQASDILPTKKRT